MKLPPWVLRELEAFEAPENGKVVLTLEYNRGGIRSLELGRSFRVQPDSARATPLTGQLAITGNPPIVRRGTVDGGERLENLRQS